MEVHNEMGPGWNEWDYHRALVNSLESKGHVIKSHERKTLLHRDEVVDQFELDLLVDDRVILELKHIRTDFHSKHFSQIINYLKCWNKRLGILINFGMDRVVSKRVPYDEQQSEILFSGKWEEVRAGNFIWCDDVVSALKSILEQYGYGYSVPVFNNLLFRELQYREKDVQRPCFKPVYRGMVFEERPLDCLKLGSELLLSISATGKNSSSADLACLKSYMRQLRISQGILIDIGRSEICLKGVL